MDDTLLLKVPGFGELAGGHSVVIIGPNGSGKTRFGVELAGKNEAEHIAALRNIELNQVIGMRQVTQAAKELTNSLATRRAKPWEMSTEIDVLFSKLLAEDSASATKYRDACARGERPPIEDTKIRILARLWRQFFPGRDLDLSNYTPIVRSSHTGTQNEYSARQMSDGERVALYLAARVIDTERRVIVVDEPEVHLHSRLAIRFWNALEALRSDCRFVYVTHDLAFAVSRHGGQFIIVQASASPTVLPVGMPLPGGVAEAILGAASLSVLASRVVFCEGEESGSLDYALYSAWYASPDITVVPVGSCDMVIQSTRSFSESLLVTGLACLGIVDRDYWPDTYLTSVGVALHVLPVHEAESLLCLREVFRAVASHHGILEADADSRYESAVAEETRSFEGGKLCHQISERFKKRLECDVLPILNGLKGSDNVADLRRGHLDVTNLLRSGVNIPGLFDAERQTIEEALASPDEAVFLKTLPGKGFLNPLSSALGLTRRAYEELICAALASDDASLRPLGTRLRTALSGYLPT